MINLRRLNDTAKTLSTQKKILLSLGVVVLLGAVVLTWADLSASRALHRQPGKTGGEQGTEDPLEAARQVLYQGTDLDACRGAIQQLNTHLEHNPEKRPGELTEAERHFLKEQLGLEEEELAEVGSPTFTLLDGHYLEAGFLFRDAARSLELQALPPREQANRAFAWVMRQVRLQETGTEPAPPEFVLRRGWGSALERDLVFLSLIQQVGLDGCLLAYPRATETGTVLETWIPGVLIDRAIWLFDTRLGMPLPGGLRPEHPGQEDQATFAQVRTQPDLLRALTLDPRYPYDVTFDQARKAEVRLVCPLSALAPRMKYLEGELGASNPVRLAVDSQALLERFQKALAGQDVRVGFWKESAGVLRRFLPRGEGGADEVHPFAFRSLRGFTNPQDDLTGQIYRQQLFAMELIPWQALPQSVRDLPADVNPGLRLRNIFGALFARFPLPPPPRDELGLGSEEGGPPDSAAEGQHTNWAKRFQYFFVLRGGSRNAGGENLVHFSLAPGTPRDDLLRGRYKDANTKLVQTGDQVRFQEAIARTEGNRPTRLARWFEEAKTAHAELILAEQEAGRDSSPQAQKTLEAAQRRVVQVWMAGTITSADTPTDSDQPRNAALIRLPIWLVDLLDAAREPMGNEANYLLALGKQEQAERLEARRARSPSGTGAQDAARAREDAWRAAADQWQKFVSHVPPGPAAAAARSLWARARQALGQSQAARALLVEDLQTDNLTSLEKTARLYQARKLSP